MFVQSVTSVLGMVVFETMCAQTDTPTHPHTHPHTHTHTHTHVIHTVLLSGYPLKCTLTLKTGSDTSVPENSSIRIVTRQPVHCDTTGKAPGEPTSHNVAMATATSCKFP